VAPVDEYQLNVGLEETPVEPFTGDARAGAGGAAGPLARVVRVHAAENALVPDELEAETRQ
jgi:hypothetical protein